MLLIPSETSAQSPLIYSDSKRPKKIMASLLQIDGIDSLGIRPRDDITGFNWSEVPVLSSKRALCQIPKKMSFYQRLQGKARGSSSQELRITF